MKFKFIETRDGIHQKLMKKFDETLMIYIGELKKVRQFYETNKANPPLMKYHPPVAGRIWWVRALFNYIRKSIVTFRTQGDVVSTEIGQQVAFNPTY
jgi:dynein heavy chain